MRVDLYAATIWLALASPAIAQAPQILYDKAPWAVARVSDSGITTCQARIISDRRLFQVVGMSDMAFIGVGAQDWHFDKHNGWLTLKVGISASKMDGALYNGNFVRIAAKVDAIYNIMLMINRPADLEVLDENDKPLATFPFTGMTEAMKAWKTCADGLPKL